MYRGKKLDRSQPGAWHIYARAMRRARLFEREDIKDLFIERMKFLLQFFQIHLCAFTIMDNHVHYVLYNRPDLAAALSDEEVIRRARAVFPSFFKKRYGLEASDPTPDRVLKDRAVVGKMRRRLSDISWFMHRLHGEVSTQINERLGSTGPVFQPFKVQDLLDIFALLACCIYVDLNMVRARKHGLPEHSKYSSIWYRLRASQARSEGRFEEAEQYDGWLMPIESRSRESGDEEPSAIPSTIPARRVSDRGMFELDLAGYSNLVDQRGRMERIEKAGAIPERVASIFDRLGMTEEQLQESVSHFAAFHSSVGKPEAMRAEARRTGKRSLQGVRLAERIERHSKPS